MLLCGSDSRAGRLCFKFKVALCQVQLSVHCQLLDQSCFRGRVKAWDPNSGQQETNIWPNSCCDARPSVTNTPDVRLDCSSQSFLFSIGIKSTPQNSFIFLGHDGKKFTKAWKQKEVNAHNLYVWNNHRVYDLRNETETQRCLQTTSLNSLKTNDRISRTDFKLYRELSKYRGPVTLRCNPSGSLVLSLHWYWQDKHKGPYSLAPSLWLL